jgi:hypothetical protein
MKEQTVLIERTAMTVRLVWMHLVSYHQNKIFASRERLLTGYNHAKELPNMEMPEQTLNRMMDYSDFVANEYLALYSTPQKLEHAIRSMAASIGIGAPSKEEERLGEIIFADIQKAVQKNRVHIDFAKR